MNIAQALAALLPGIPVHESPPAPLPPTAYVVISELPVAKLRPFYVVETGEMLSLWRMPLLVTLYGREGWKLADLRPNYHKLMRLADRGAAQITEHPGLPNIRGVSVNAPLPPTPDPQSRRPYAGVRLLITYVE